MATTIEPEQEIAVDLEANEPDSNPPTGRQPRPAAKQKSLLGKAWRQSMMMIRRVHLYSGIFMFPFVLLYGFSGWFFNHPGYFRDGEVTRFAAVDVADARLAELPSAAELAAAVVEQMNLESFLVDGPEVALTKEKVPRFSGFFNYTVQTELARHEVTINPIDGSGTIQTVVVDQDAASAEKPTPENPLAMVRSATLASNPLDAGGDAVPAVLRQLGLSSGEAVAGRRAPSVVFSVDAGDVPCLVTYNLGSGSITSVRQDARPDLGFQDQLRRMHMARIYSPQYDIRWVWALVVDAMFVSMVFWGCSGLFMWWQVKRTRMLGAGVLLASLLFSGIMFLGMHDNLTEGSGRRSGAGGHGAPAGRGGGRRSAAISESPAVVGSLASANLSATMSLGRPEAVCLIGRR